MTGTQAAWCCSFCCFINDYGSKIRAVWLHCQQEYLGLFSHFLPPVQATCRGGITRHFFLLSVKYFLSAGIGLKCSNPYPIKLTSFCKWQLATEQFRGAEIVPVKQNNQTFVCISFTLRKLQHRFNIKLVSSVLLSCGTLKRMLSQLQKGA